MVAISFRNGILWCVGDLIPVTLGILSSCNFKTAVITILIIHSITLKSTFVVDIIGGTKFVGQNKSSHSTGKMSDRTLDSDVTAKNSIIYSGSRQHTPKHELVVL